MLETPVEEASFINIVSFFDFLKQSSKHDFFLSAFPALASGATQAILFNPIDRALYIRVQHRRKKFIDRRNFQRPFQSFFNAAMYRTLASASYMFWQDTFVICIRRFLPSFFHSGESPRLNSFIVGLAAGSISGFTLNVLQAVKFRVWSLDSKCSSFFRTGWYMYKEAGVLIFFRGCVPTIARDSVFGVVYESTRRSNFWERFYDRYLNGLLSSHVQPYESTRMEGSTNGNKAPDFTASTTPATRADIIDKELLPVQKEERNPKRSASAFISNMIAATLASIVSSPFNYVRSVVYGTPPSAVPLKYTTLHRSFLIQLMYVYRNGESYIEKHSVPNYRNVGYNGTEVSLVHHPISESPSNRIRPVVNQLLTPKEWILPWAKRHHPVAACQWASSRLNIGWGSIRVGLGMAIGQGIFHLIQDCIIKLNDAVH